MWKNLGKVLWLLISSELYAVNCEYFTIIGPKTLRADEPYKVAVTSHGLNPSTVAVGIEGTGYDGEEFEVSRDVEILPGETSLVKLNVRKLLKLLKLFYENLFFQLEDLRPGKFILKANGDNFSKNVSLYYNSQRVSFLIQLNKPFYRPDGLLEFRIFTINSRTKPYKIRNSSKIWFLDPGNNRVKVWEDPEFHRGLFEGNLLLVDAEPGKWTILIEVDGEVSFNFNFNFQIFTNFPFRLLQKPSKLSKTQSQFSSFSSRLHAHLFLTAMDLSE